MTRHPIRSTGNSRPHIVATGYQHTPRVAGPIRPEGEPSLFTGMLIVVGGFILIAALVMVVEGMMP